MVKFNSHSQTLFIFGVHINRIFVYLIRFLSQSHHLQEMKYCRISLFPNLFPELLEKDVTEFLNVERMSKLNSSIHKKQTFFVFLSSILSARWSGHQNVNWFDLTWQKGLWWWYRYLWTLFAIYQHLNVNIHATTGILVHLQWLCEYWNCKKVYKILRIFKKRIFFNQSYHLIFNIITIETYRYSEIHVKCNPFIWILPESQNKMNVSDENKY